jgi:hypothetical protein
MVLNGDQTFRIHGTALNGGAVDVDGRWVYTVRRELGVHVWHVPVGDPGNAGQDIRLGFVRSVDEQKLVLDTGGGDEQYQQVQ